MHALQVLRHDLMKLPSRAATHAEANAVTAEIAALQTEVERADTMTEVSSALGACQTLGVSCISL